MTDLRFGTTIPTSEEVAAVEEVVVGAGPATVNISERLVLGGRSRAVARRNLLLPSLHALQRAVGWISPGGLDHVCRVLEISPADAYGVATFYHLFNHCEPVADSTVHVCDDIVCRSVGAADLIKDLCSAGHHVRPSPCLGQCERGPAVLVQRTVVEDQSVAPAKLADVEAAIGSGNSSSSVAVPQAGSGDLRLLARVGVVDPGSLDDYRAYDGYLALDAAVAMGPDRVIRELTASGLSGRGGAAFPTGVKWKAVADQVGRPKHVVCNADESEPGTFKDRTLMEGDPFSVVEAMTIAGLAVGAKQGWIYLRGEYPVAADRLRVAIDIARGAGFLGEDVAGSGHRFDIELRRGAGAYVCGEETALFNSIEGYRGEPRNKPPFPTIHGLFGEPTAINNVETLVNVLPIVKDGASTYVALGTEYSPGTRLFCVSGRVASPGTYEHVFGVTLGDVIAAAGGLARESGLRAVLLGGAAGSFVGPEDMGLPLTLEATREAGLSLGSGVVMVFDEDDDIVDTVGRIAEFFRNESCGQCVPCRVGTVRQEEVLVRLRRGGSLQDERGLLDDLGSVMRDASICGLGQMASGAVHSAFNLGLLGSAP